MSTASDHDPEVLDGLMREAELRARTLLERRGGCAPFVHMNGVDGTVTYYEGDGALLSKKEMEEFKKSARLTCIQEGADAAVFVAEAWLTRKNSHLVATDQASAETADREEAIVLLGETRRQSSQRILPILRHPDGRFRDFGMPYCKESARGWRDNLEFLPAWVPTPAEREAVSDALWEQAKREWTEEERQRWKNEAEREG